MVLKKLFRFLVALMVVGPFILFVHIARLFIGKEKAVSLCGPYATSVAKIFLKVLLPNISGPWEFDLFRSETKRKFWLWRPLFDFEVKEDNENILKLNIWNCPFCEVLNLAGVHELNWHVCRGDWEFAEDNKGKWEFEREHDIGRGDRFCDHTYKRISNLQQ